MLLRRKDWQMPEGLEKVAPQQMINVMLQRGLDGKPLPEGEQYTAGHRIAATKVLQDMARDNDRRLVAAVRLSQLDRRTAIMEEHPEVLAGGNTTTNNVVIILPEKADPSEFALPSERTVLPAPSGNGNGRPKG